MSLINFQNATANIMELFEYSKQNVIEVGYLIQIIKKFPYHNGINEVKESLFQFNPSYNEKGRSQTFSSFHKEILLSSIAWIISIEISKKLDNIFDSEDFGLFCQNLWLTDKQDNAFFKILLKNNFYDFSSEEIVSFFLEDKEIKNIIDKYVNYA